DRARRPMPARLAMAVAHYRRLATDRELNCAAKTAALVGLSVAHDAAPYWFELAPPMRGSSDTLMSLGKHYFRSITTSRYSLGTTSEPGPAVLHRSSSAVMSFASAACPAASSAANALCVGP